ncbi:MAG: nitrilase-related carbon-nitrogen hydrolase [Bacteroidota bacterium]|nr:nitrilase-related carbon-nitrogen hydrolase [Bacteroidota bacterium]
MIIGYIQNSPAFGTKEQNLKDIDNLMKGKKADLMVLPELCATGYCFTSMGQVFDQAEDLNGPTAQFLCKKSLETGGAIVAGFVEKEGDCCYNSSMMISGGKVVDVYRKLHLFDREKLFFSPGNYPLKVNSIKGFRIGMMICFDWMFPEVARILALDGVQILAHPSNLVLPDGQRAMAIRCLENRVFAVTANRVGTERIGGISVLFTGGSQIVSPEGNILSAAPPDKETVDILEVDPLQADNKMITPRNDVLGDRRTDLYRHIIS